MYFENVSLLLGSILAVCSPNDFSAVNKYIEVSGGYLRCRSMASIKKITIRVGIIKTESFIMINVL